MQFQWYICLVTTLLLLLFCNIIPMLFLSLRFGRLTRRLLGFFFWLPSYVLVSLMSFGDKAHFAWKPYKCDWFIGLFPSFYCFLPLVQKFFRAKRDIFSQRNNLPLHSNSWMELLEFISVLRDFIFFFSCFFFVWALFEMVAIQHSANKN